MVRLADPRTQPTDEERDELARRDAALDADTEWDGDENDSDAEGWS